MSGGGLGLELRPEGGYPDAVSFCSNDRRFPALWVQFEPWQWTTA